MHDRRHEPDRTTRMFLAQCTCNAFHRNIPGRDFRVDRGGHCGVLRVLAISDRIRVIRHIRDQTKKTSRSALIDSGSVISASTKISF